MKKNNLTLGDTFVKAIQEYKKKNFKTTEIICYKILSIDPNHFGSLVLLSNISARSRDYNQAKKLLYKVLDLQPNNINALNNLGTAHGELGELDEAIKFYEKVLSIDSNNVTACYQLGLIFHKSKKFGGSCFGNGKNHQCPGRCGGGLS